jgi:hypothetical protein
LYKNPKLPPGIYERVIISHQQFHSNFITYYINSYPSPRNQSPIFIMTDAQIAGGHKATLNNPNTSEAAKEHSKKVLDQEFNGGDGMVFPTSPFIIGVTKLIPAGQ